MLRTTILVIIALTGCQGRIFGQLKWENKEIEVPLKIGQTEMRGEFTFLNQGSYAITVEKLTPSCGCVSVELDKDKRIYAPGEQGTVKVKMEVGTRPGKIVKSLAVTTNDEASSTVLRLLALVPELVTLEPDALWWIKGSEPNAKAVSIKVTSKRPLRIIGVKASTDRMTATIKPIKDGAEYVLTLTPTTTADVQTVTIFLETDIEVHNQKHVIPLSAYIK